MNKRRGKRKIARNKKKSTGRPNRSRSKTKKQKNKCDWKIFSVNNSKEETEQTSRMRKKEKGREKKRHGEEMKT